MPSNHFNILNHATTNIDSMNYIPGSAILLVLLECPAFSNAVNNAIKNAFINAVNSAVKQCCRLAVHCDAGTCLLLMFFMLTALLKP